MLCFWVKGRGVEGQKHLFQRVNETRDRVEQAVREVMLKQPLNSVRSVGFRRESAKQPSRQVLPSPEPKCFSSPQTGN